MKTILRVILGVTIAVSPLLAGQEPTEKEKQSQDEARKKPPPNQQEEPQPPEKPKSKPEKPQAEPATPPKQQKPDEKQQQQQQEQDKQKQAIEEEKKSKDSKQQQGQTGQQNSRTQQSTQASHGKEQRIPSEKFQSNFGSQHYFQMQDLQDGRRFQHAGYWFEIVEVWPADWSYDDLCYVGEDAGEYYIADVYHPGVRVSVIVVGG